MQMMWSTIRRVREKYTAQRSAAFKTTQLGKFFKLNSQVLDTSRDLVMHSDGENKITFTYCIHILHGSL